MSTQAEFEARAADALIEHQRGRIAELEAALRRCNEASTAAGNDERHTPQERAGARMIGAIVRKEMAALGL